MLLIQSDMMKALWYMIHPIVAFIHGDVPTTSSFCQASGFFIALSIEASGMYRNPKHVDSSLTSVDFAILMIAIHTALYIWKPSPSIGEGGLYPYRHLAYVMWVIFPALSAGLAFVNPDHAYTSQGTYCYLPVRPLWYPVGLAWTPRYIIFITISTIYIAIYAYVHYKFNDLDSNMGHSYMEENATALNEINAGVDYDPRAMDPQLEIPTTPPLPTLTRHGLIPSNTPSAVDPNSRKASIASNDNVRPVSQGSDWVDQAFGGLDTRLKSGLQAERPTNLEASQFNSLRNIPGTSEASPPSDNHSFVGILHALRNGNDPTPDTPIHHQPQLGLPSDATLTLVDSQGYTGATEELHQKRIAIRRQLRFLFIYPLVYMFMWIIPFISHVLQYTNWYVRNPSLALTALVTVIVPLQCAVDSWLFSTREKVRDFDLLSQLALTFDSLGDIFLDPVGHSSRRFYSGHMIRPVKRLANPQSQCHEQAQARAALKWQQKLESHTNVEKKSLPGVRKNLQSDRMLAK
jgi:G protein-coupled receptor GPR1